MDIWEEGGFVAVPELKYSEGIFKEQLVIGEVSVYR